MADRRQRAATTSNIDDTIPEGRPIPGERRDSFIEPSSGRAGRRLSHLFSRLTKKRHSTDFSTTSLAHAQKNNTVNIQRPVYTQEGFDDGFGMQEQGGFDVKAKLKKCVSVECSKRCCKDSLYKFLPFIKIMKSYMPREDLPGDVIAGLTVGIMNIPQGMAYALLASVPPIYGLYVSFFPLLIYFFFGGSKHISIGTFAVVSLMVGGAIESQMDFCEKLVGSSPTTAMPNVTDPTTAAGNLTSSTPAGGGDDIDPRLTVCKMGLATTLTILVGASQILMGFLRLGFVTIYLADPLISGFTTGAACHVFTSQVKYIFGIKVQRFNGPFKLIRTYKDMFMKMGDPEHGIIWAEVIIAAICIITLVLVKECINDRFKKKMKMPVPIDLIVVVLGTVISAVVNLSDRYQVTILGTIPAEFPTPEPPPFYRFTELIPSAITIAIVSFAVSVSMAKIFAKKHNYEIDANQEFLAYGVSNVFSSFFLCFPSCASLSRSAVQDNQGGKTQVAGLISCSLILIVLVAIGPYFASLPNSILASIILVALKGLFKQFTELKRLWYISIYDFLIWLITWLGVVILDVDIGLIVGVVFGLLTVVFRTQYPNTTILGRVPHTDLYKDKYIYSTVQEVQGIKIFRIDASLYYANVEHFRKKLYKLTEVNPRTIKLTQAKIESRVAKEIADKKKDLAKRKKQAAQQLGDYDQEAMPSLEGQMDTLGREDEHFDVVPAKSREGWPQPLAHHIIIDCSMMSYVDSVGVNMLRSVFQEYNDVEIAVFLVNCKAAVRDMFRKCNFYEKVPEDHLYLTIHDAVIAALSQRRDLLDEVNRDTTIVSRPSSIYGSRNPSMANIMMSRRASQPVSFGFKQRGSTVGIHTLPPQGEDNELKELDAENNKLDEQSTDPSADPVNGEVSTAGKVGTARKQSCHM